MIVSKKTGLKVILRESVPIVLALCAWDFLVVILYQIFHKEWMEQPALPVSIIGSAIALMMGVRNSSAYARWWEARTLWGAVVNNSRSFGRQANALLHASPDLARAMASYPHALRHALGTVDASADVERLLPADMAARIEGWSNRPNAILYQIGLRVSDEVAKKNIDGAVHGQIDRILSDLANAQGGLERIAKTPLPAQYSVVPRFLTNIFCIILPLSMVQTLGWITPLGSSIVGLLFVILDETGADLENPFDDSPHGLPMRAMATTIEIDLLQPVGEEHAPPVTAEDGILL